MEPAAFRLPRPATRRPTFPPAARLETREGAYELKLLLDDRQVEAVLAWAREHLPADPHAASDGTYSVRSVYLDTPDLAVYRRRPGYDVSKYRIRRYGEEGTCYLEEKRKRDGWVTKVRTPVSGAELARLEAGRAPADWAGAWFERALEERGLVPTCQVAYRRLAREGWTEGSPVRLTLDRELVCSGARGLCPGWTGEAAVPLGINVLELKFRESVPALFRELIRTFQLSAAPDSKYRRAAALCAPGLRGERAGG